MVNCSICDDRAEPSLFLKTLGEGCGTGWSTGGAAGTLVDDLGLVLSGPEVGLSGGLREDFDCAGGFDFFMEIFSGVGRS